LELYNLKNDIGEHHNLASKEKKRADKMAKQLNTWRKSVKAKMPTTNPAYEK